MITPKNPSTIVSRALLAAKDMRLGDTRSFLFLEFPHARAIEKAITNNSKLGKYGNGRIITVDLIEENERFTVTLTKKESIGVQKVRRRANQ